MRNLLSFLFILTIGVFCSACVNTFAVHELNEIAAQHIEAGEIKGAISRLESSIDLDPNIYESRYNLAVTYITANRCQEAVEQIEEAKKLTKNEPAVFYTAGSAYECAARNLMEEKTPEKAFVPIKFLTEEQEIKAGQKSIEYLKLAIENMETYVKMAPNAEDAPNVYSHINIVKNKLSINEEKYSAGD